jgi:hypothetical protein
MDRQGVSAALRVGAKLAKFVANSVNIGGKDLAIGALNSWPRDARIM